MFKLSSVITVILLSFNGLAQSPHGDRLEIKCDVCHSPANWLMKVENTTFNHSQTSYPLTGQHMAVDCKLCHVDLVFSNAKTTCISCHKDMHQQTVGLDCERCHSPRSWIVQNITEIHQLSRFPLNATHSKADCYQCHKSASLLRFDPMGISCSDCHLKDYNATNKDIEIEKMSELLSAKLVTDESWTEFKKKFDAVYPDFITKITMNFGKLTPTETRLACLIKLQISNKDIASMLGISTDSVLKSRDIIENINNYL